GHTDTESNNSKPLIDRCRGISVWNAAGHSAVIRHRGRNLAHGSNSAHWGTWNYISHPSRQGSEAGDGAPNICHFGGHMPPDPDLVASRPGKWRPSTGRRLAERPQLSVSSDSANLPY